MDKSDRVQRLVEALGPAMQMGSHVEVAREAARLGRADLGSAVVTELTSLAGTMGRIYAQHGGGARQTNFDSNGELAWAGVEVWVTHRLRNGYVAVPSCPLPV